MAPSKRRGRRSRADRLLQDAAANTWDGEPYTLDKPWQLQGKGPRLLDLFTPGLRSRPLRWVRAVLVAAIGVPLVATAVVWCIDLLRR